MSSKPPFTGEGFSRDPLSDDEIASHREMRRELSENWDSITGLTEITKGASRVVKVVGVMMTLGAVAAYAVKQGFLQ